MRVYNTLGGQKQELQTVKPHEVNIYVCGPTTYNYIHLGNARPLVVFDTIRRYLEYRGQRVKYVQNFTDVDDKIIKRANQEGRDPVELAAGYIEEYFKDADALNIRRADVHPRVSQHIQQIIAAIGTLVEKGAAYQVDGDVYFRVRSFPEYGKLSGRSREEMLSGARVEVDERKEDPADFALWKAANGRTELVGTGTIPNASGYGYPLFWGKQYITVGEPTSSFPIMRTKLPRPRRLRENPS